MKTENFDCIISWRHLPDMPVIAGFPIRQEFKELPNIDDVVEFEASLTARYGLGEEIPQEKHNAKIISITKSNSEKFDYTLLMEKVA